MESRVSKILKKNKIFSCLGVDICHEIAPLFKEVNTQAEELLIRQGDESDCLYILEKGALFAYLDTAKGTKFMGSVLEGESVGELGALSGEPRSLSVKAASEALLLRLSSNDFKYICQTYPQLMLEILKTIINRSQKNTIALSNVDGCKYIGIIKQNESVDIEEFKQSILKNISHQDGIILLSNLNCSSPDFLRKLNNYEKKSHTIFVFFEQEDLHIAKFLLEKASKIYLVSYAQDIEQNSYFINNFLEKTRALNSLTVSLVLIHHRCSQMIHGTQKWLSFYPFLQWHHMRLHNEQDACRLIRFFCDNPIGLVLGGGGTRGWAHVGVLKAFQEQGIPFDVIGGTSIGALIGASANICDSNFEQVHAIVQRFSRDVSPPFSWSDYTYPRISILNGKRVTRALEDLFGVYHIENLWRPYFGISSNVTSMKEVVHTKGSLFESVRASVALPGLLPPMTIDYCLHYDGGLCNNLPVDRMKGFIGNSGKIISVSLLVQEESKKYYIPPVFSYSDYVLKSLTSKESLYRIPSYFETIYNSMTVGSVDKEIECKRKSDILINPDLSAYGITSNPTGHEDKMIAIGYKAAQEALQGWSFSPIKGLYLKK